MPAIGALSVSHLLDTPFYTILYTVGLRGRLDALPALFTFIQRERTAIANPLVLLDLGESCIDGDPLCDGTDGRALLVAMDGMGYDAFYLDASDRLATDAATRDKLRATIQTPLVTDSTPFLLTKRALTKPDQAGQSSGQNLRLCLAGVGQTDVPDADWQIRLARGAAPAHISAPHTLRVAAQSQGDEIMLGRIDVGQAADAAGWGTVTQTRLALPPDVRPDATMLSVVDFVRAEARYATRKRL